MATKTKGAVGYIRVSTEEQARGGVSLDFQREAIEGYAKAQGLEMVGWFSDETSGKDMDGRPGFKEALKAACDRGAALCVYALSRASRSTRDAIALADRLDRYGAELISITERIDTTAANGRLMFRILASFAEFERELIVERVRDGMAECRRQGRRLTRKDRVPYGFRAMADDPGRLEPDAGEKKRLALIGRRRRDGERWCEIARELNGREWFRRGGKVWNGYEVMRTWQREQKREK